MDMSTRPGDEDSRPDGFEPDDETAAGEDPDEPGWGDGIFGRADPRLLLERIYWPTLAIAGLLLFALCYAPWGRGTSDATIGITGLGAVEVDGGPLGGEEIRTELQQWTASAGIATLVLAAIIVVVALLAWWQPRLRLAGFVVVVLAGIGAIINTSLVIAQPAEYLFKDWAVDAVGDTIPVAAGYGVIGALICAAVIVVVALAGLVGRLRFGPARSR